MSTSRGPVAHREVAVVPPEPPRWPLLGTYVDGFTLSGFLSTVRAGVERNRRTLIANHNVNSLALYQRDAEFRLLYSRTDYVFIDGTPVVGLARLFGAHAHTRHRVAVLDWIWPLFALAEREGWSVVHLGGAEDVLERASQRAAGRHPHLWLTTIHGYFGAEENDAVLARIRHARPQVLLVGMGMPRQERWLLHNLNELPDCVVITVGGILGYLGEDRPTPPRWLGPTGLEWLFRLTTEPRRLWRRYLLEPLPLVPVIVRELLQAPAEARHAPRALRSGTAVQSTATEAPEHPRGGGEERR
jgi:N-acetylglucosaminyldiphosphoundecaprenol N-acetyl-beta-D-mannosaminyltransferase